MLNEDGFDLLLTDVVVHGLSGRETGDGLRELQPGLAVLYRSGYTDDAVVRRGVLSAGTALVQKPFSSDELARNVRGLLDGRVNSGLPDLSSLARTAAEAAAAAGGDGSRRSPGPRR